MQGALEKFMAFNNRLARACLGLAALGLAYCTVVIGWQIFSRYLLNNSPQWSETSVLFVMVWFIMIAAAAGVHEKTHIGLSFAQELLPARAKRISQVAVHLIVAGFGAGMVYYGSQQAISTWHHVIPTLTISVGVSYLPFPLAGCLFILFSAEHIWRAIKG